MRVLIQRVSSASVVVDGRVTGEIGKGLLAYIGFSNDDTEEQMNFCVEKMVNLRVFGDDEGKMNHSVTEEKGGLLLVSQFTLYGNTKKGRRPGYDQAASGPHANELYDLFVQKCRETGLKVETGVFQAHMEVSSVNDGPVTFMIERE